MVTLRSLPRSRKVWGGKIVPCSKVVNHCISSLGIGQERSASTTEIRQVQWSPNAAVSLPQASSDCTQNSCPGDLQICTDPRAPAPPRASENSSLSMKCSFGKGWVFGKAGCHGQTMGGEHPAIPARPMALQKARLLPWLEHSSGGGGCFVPAEASGHCQQRPATQPLHSIP